MAVMEIAPGVWSAGTRWVSWYVVDGGTDGLTLVDGGLPSYRRHLDPALAAIGRQRSDLRAIVLTHGHIDHIGLAAAVARDGAKVYLHPADTRLAADPRTNKTDRSVVRYLAYPATVAFVAHCVVNGAVNPPPFPESVALTEGESAGIPGAPVVTHVPGHTDGSCVLEFREHGVVFVGDLLCTVSPVMGSASDPQLQTRGSNRNSDQAMQSLERLHGVASRMVLPGHGRPWRDGVEAAIESARRIGCR